MILPCALIFCATVFVYLPALAGNLIWNDGDYVTKPALRSLAGLVRIWAEPGATEQYYPLLHSFFWMQYQLFGDHPLGYHVVNLLLHVCSAVLFALVIRRMLAGDAASPVDVPTECRGRSAVGAGSDRRNHPTPQPYAGAEWVAGLLFALHPVHVESVAWITEQKNTLSLACYLAAALVYLRFDMSRRPRSYLIALALFVCSMWCKTVTATLPAALLVVFWWKRGRLGWRRDVWPLMPWLILGAALGLFSSWVEHAYVGARGTAFELSLVGRTLVAGRAVWFYAGQLVWPFGLNFIYPRWTVDAAVWWQWLFPLGVLAVGAVLWALRRRTRAPLATYLFFVGSLFPVLGFVNLFGALYSWVWDHWQYLADLGPLALAAAGLTAVWHRAPRHLRGLGAGLAAGLAVLLGALTWSHCTMFRDDETLFLTTLARNPGCWMAHNNLGLIWRERPGRQNDAIAQFQESLRLNPNNAEAHYNLGITWAQMPGRLNEAMTELQEAVRLEPDYADAHNNLGNVWAQMPGRLEDAIAEYRTALHLNPDNAEAHYNLGITWAQLPGRLNEATTELQKAVRLKPKYADAHNNLGITWAQMPGHLNDAIAEFREVVRLNPDNASAWHNLGGSLYDLGDLPGAAAAFREELRLLPDDPSVRQALTEILQQIKGR